MRASYRLFKNNRPLRNLLVAFVVLSACVGVAFAGLNYSSSPPKCDINASSALAKSTATAVQLLSLPKRRKLTISGSLDKEGTSC